MSAKGFTLIELMIAVGIIAVLSAVAIPLYNGYIETGHEGTLISSISTIEIFQEDVRMRTGAFGVGNWDVAGGDTSIQAAIGWAPQANDGTVYQVALGGGGYTVTATNTAGYSMCIQFPAKTLC